MALESGRRKVVGVNEYINDNEKIDIPLLKVTNEDEARQVTNMQEMRKNRNNTAVEKTLKALEKAARGDDNLMPYIMDCAREYGSLGEIVEVLKGVFGEYREQAMF